MDAKVFIFRNIISIGDSKDWNVHFYGWKTRCIGCLFSIFIYLNFQNY